VVSSRRVSSPLEPKALPPWINSSAFSSASSKVGGGDHDKFSSGFSTTDEPNSIGSLAFEPTP
jgi:hypothetical protein